MGRLHDRMAEDLRLRNFSPTIQRIYLFYARRFAPGRPSTWSVLAIEVYPMMRGPEARELPIISNRDWGRGDG